MTKNPAEIAGTRYKDEKLMSRVQKTDGTSRCFAQIENIKRQSLNTLTESYCWVNPKSFAYLCIVNRRSTRTDRNWSAFVSTARAQEKHRKVDMINSQSASRSVSENCRTWYSVPPKNYLRTLVV